MSGVPTPVPGCGASGTAWGCGDCEDCLDVRLAVLGFSRAPGESASEAWRRAAVAIYHRAEMAAVWTHDGLEQVTAEVMGPRARVSVRGEGGTVWVEVRLPWWRRRQRDRLRRLLVTTLEPSRPLSTLLELSVR